MSTSTPGICPKCKGYLMIEKDNYGLYHQCLQCGYIHDLQAANRLRKKRAREDNAEISQRNITESMYDEPRNAPQQTEYSLIEYLKVPPNLQPILNYLLKELRNKPCQK